MDYWFDKEREIQLYNSDCNVLLDRMIKQNVKIDCVICDPDHKTILVRETKQKSLKSKPKDYLNDDIEIWLPKVYDLLKDTGHCYITSNNNTLFHYLQVAKECGFYFVKSLIWKRSNKIANNYYTNQFEYILFFRKGKIKKIVNKEITDIFEVPLKKLKNKKGEVINNSEKPIKLMEILIENSTTEQGLVLDFMMGTGSTAIACKNLNRKFIGVEIERKYFTTTIKRIKGEL